MYPQTGGDKRLKSDRRARVNAIKKASGFAGRTETPSFKKATYAAGLRVYRTRIEQILSYLFFDDFFVVFSEFFGG